MGLNLKFPRSTFDLVQWEISWKLSELCLLRFYWNENYSMKKTACMCEVISCKMKSKHLAKENTPFASVHTSCVYFIYLSWEMRLATKAVSCFLKKHAKRNIILSESLNMEVSLNVRGTKWGDTHTVTLAHKIRHTEIISCPKISKLGLTACGSWKCSKT